MITLLIFDPGDCTYQEIATLSVMRIKHTNPNPNRTNPFRKETKLTKKVCEDGADLLCKLICTVRGSHDYEPTGKRHEDYFDEISTLLDGLLDSASRRKEMILYNPYDDKRGVANGTYFGSILMEIFDSQDVEFPEHIVSKIIDLGGTDLLMMERGINHESALHVALKRGVKPKHILHMLEVGGMSLLNITPISYHTITGLAENALDMGYCAVDVGHGIRPPTYDSVVTIKMMQMAHEYIFSNSCYSYPDVHVEETDEEANQWMRGESRVMSWANSFVHVARRLGLEVPNGAVGDMDETGLYWQVKRVFLTDTLCQLRWRVLGSKAVEDMTMYGNRMRSSTLLQLMRAGPPNLPVTVLREIVLWAYPFAGNYASSTSMEQKMALLDEHDALMKRGLL
jgi:hypothetical protein